jgi:transcriptional regulator with AAA-type ATPase domain
VLSQLIGREDRPAQPAPPAEIDLETLGPPYDDLRKRIEHAALLGLPILLQGERGAGKTFLAHYYHRRRQVYRGLQTRAPGRGQARRDGKDSSPRSERVPEKTGESGFITVTLSEFADVDTLRDALFGWAKGSWTGAERAFDGLLGEAHGGTLFLDEIHHLERPLQSALLGPLNSRRYRPKMAAYEIVSQFDLVVATNDPEWRRKLADDFRDRIERIVLEVPSFKSLQRSGEKILWDFWNFTLRRRCWECNLDYTEDSEDRGWVECRDRLLGVFKRNPLPGNWRDLQRLADNLLLHLTEPRDGRPSQIRWNPDYLERAIEETFSER